MTSPLATPLLLLGGGGHAAVVADAALAAGWAVEGFFDDSPKAQLPGLARLGSIHELAGWRRDNTHAIALYHDEGFNEIGRRPRYYPAKDGREDALVMAMELFPEGG